MSTEFLVTEKPEHIPQDAVYEFNIFDPLLLEDPHKGAMEQLRNAPAVFWTPHNGGHWVTRNYAEAFTVLRTSEIFSSALVTPEEMEGIAAMLPPDTKRLPVPVPIILDPPEHTKFRLPLQKAFSPKTISALQTDIEELAQQLIDAVADQGGCEFIAAVGEQLPVRVFLRMMGLPESRLGEFRELVREVFAPAGSDVMLALTRLRRIVDVMSDTIQARKTDPKDDLISMLWALDIDGEPMSDELMEDYSVLLFLAGLDTVVNAIGFGVRHMAMYPELQRTLKEDPEQIPEAVEELLRRYTMTLPIRRVIKDTELGGRSIKVDDRVITYLPVADLDESEFPNPEVFDLQRENKLHMAFGMGPHRCLGSHLARLELQTLYRVLLERLPEFRLDANQHVKFHVGQMLAVASLPIRWD